MESQDYREILRGANKATRNHYPTGQIEVAGSSYNPFQPRKRADVVVEIPNFYSHQENANASLRSPKNVPWPGSIAPRPTPPMNSVGSLRIARRVFLSPAVVAGLLMGAVPEPAASVLVVSAPTVAVTLAASPSNRPLKSCVRRTYWGTHPVFSIRR